MVIFTYIYFLIKITMQILQKTLCLLLVSALALSAGKPTLKSNLYITQGRTDKTEDNRIILAGPGSSVTFSYKGSQCTINVQSLNNYNQYDYIAIEVDGKYIGKEKVNIKPSNLSINIPSGENDIHKVTVYKATEAGNGSIIFSGAEGNIVKTKKEKGKKKIEFIGDSITCGMGNETEEIPCGTGEWFDQHNAYFAYGPVTSRALNADFVLSSVSGIGIYRNWNDEHEKEKIMPDVYENIYLNNSDKTVPYKFGFNPDITCIALGTNDFSDGDGKKERLPFNTDKYVESYINFIKIVYSHSPNTQIVLLTSPMVKGEKAKIFANCLKRVQAAYKDDKKHKPVQVFDFSDITPHGCGYHPDVKDHQEMANELAPFLKSLLNE